MNNIADPQQQQWTTRLFPDSAALWQHLADLYPPQQWMRQLFPFSTAIMEQFANLYPQMQMQGHAPPWYPLQGNPPAGYTWESYPPQYVGVLLPQAHPPEGYPNDVYPPPQPQLSELRNSGALVVNNPPEGYPNNVYPPPQQQFSGLHFSEGLVVENPPEGYPTQGLVVDYPLVGYPNDVYPPPPQQYNELHFSEGMSVQSHTHTQTGGGQNNSQMQGVSELNTQGDFIMGSNGGNTNAFYLFSINFRGNRAIDNSSDDLAASNMPGSEVLLLYRQV